MRRTKEIKLNALRAEIQRLRDISFHARMRVMDAEAGAQQTVMLTEMLIAAVLEACGIEKITVKPDHGHRLKIEWGEDGYTLERVTGSYITCENEFTFRLATESDIFPIIEEV